jgi:conjugal transfer/entry exclusion protein
MDEATQMHERPGPLPPAAAAAVTQSDTYSTSKMSVAQQYQHVNQVITIRYIFNIQTSINIFINKTHGAEGGRALY